MESLYKWFWFNVQFWLSPEKRRPFTYLFRDLYHKYPLIVITFGSIALYLLGRYTTQISILTLLGMVVALFTGIVLGHIYWGRVYKPDQQEEPTYLGEDEY